MLVLVVDKLGGRHARALQALPSEQKFALTVFSGFAVALALLAVLFALSSDPAAVGRTGRQLSDLVPRGTSSLSADGAGTAPVDASVS